MTTQNTNFSIIRDSIVNGKMVSVIVAKDLTKELAATLYNKISKFNSTTQIYTIVENKVISEPTQDFSSDNLDYYFAEKEENNTNWDFDNGNFN